MPEGELPQQRSYRRRCVHAVEQCLRAAAADDVDVADAVRALRTSPRSAWPTSVPGSPTPDLICGAAMRTLSASSRGSPVCSANAITGTSPADDTKWSSSNSADSMRTRTECLFVGVGVLIGHAVGGRGGPRWVVPRSRHHPITASPDHRITASRHPLADRSRSEHVRSCEDARRTPIPGERTATPQRGTEAVSPKHGAPHSPRPAAWASRSAAAISPALAAGRS